MRIAVVQYETRRRADLYDLMKLNEQVCAKHDELFYELGTRDDSLPPYWKKVEIVSKFLPQYDGVLWLDSDAVLHNVDRLMYIIRNTQHFLCSGECCNYTHNFNAGVWFVRNTSIGRHILHDWYDLYKSQYYKDWQQDRKTMVWSTPNEWSGDSYEQGAFTKHLVPKYKQYIRSVPWYVLNNPIPIFQNQAATQHFYWKFKVFAMVYMWIRTHVTKLSFNLTIT